MIDFFKYVGVHNVHNSLKISKNDSILLGSSSPRRIELLKNIIKEFEISKPYIDENKVLSNSLSNCKDLPFVENSFLACSNIALEKAIYISKNYTDSMVISADTIVVTNDKILGKPKDKNDAYKTLTSLLGNTHYVATAVCMYKGKDNYSLFYVVSVVEFVEKYELPIEFIKSYVSSNSPMDKAGSYGIQEVGSEIVKNIYGDYYNIVGFPVIEIRRRLYENFG